MNKLLNRGTALMIAMGFLAGASILAMPAGAAGPRAPAFDVSVTFTQAGQPVTTYDFNTGGNLTIDMLISNTGSNTSTASVVLGVEWDDDGSMADWSQMDLHTWSPQVLDNGTPTPLSSTWETVDDPWLPMITPYCNVNVYVNVTDGAVSLNYSKKLNLSVAAGMVDEITSTTSNAIDPHTLVLGVDTLTVKTNVTIIAIGKETTGVIINFYLDDMMGDPIGNVSMGNMPNGTLKQYEFVTNLSEVSPAPSFDDHIIYAEAALGVVGFSNMSEESFTIIAPVPDVILTGIEIDPMAVTIHKGETVPVTITAHLLNNGTASAASAAVKFYDGLTELCATTTEAIAAQATLEVEYVWSITDAIALGNHTIAIGVDSEGAPDYWVEENMTVTGVANVSMTSLAVSAASEFENATVTFTAKLFNNGTVDSALLTVEFYDGTTMIGSKPNVTVAKGQTVDVTFQWTLPLVDADTNKNIKAKVAGVEGSVALTIKNKVPAIEFSPMVLPAGMRQYDDVVFNITVKNNGSANAVGVVLKITQGGATYCTTAPFNLSVGEQKTIQASLEILEPGNANQTFIATATVGGMSFTTNATVKVLPYIFGKIGITAFKVTPSKKDNQPKDSTQTFKATLTLKNIGEKSGTVSVMILDGLKILVNTNVSVDALASKNVTYDLKIKGAGSHKLTAMVGLPDPDTGNMTKTAKCELQYQPGFETVVLVGAVLVAIVLLRRRKN